MEDFGGKTEGHSLNQAWPGSMADSCAATSRTACFFVERFMKVEGFFKKATVCVEMKKRTENFVEFGLPPHAWWLPTIDRRWAGQLLNASRLLLCWTKIFGQYLFQRGHRTPQLCAQSLRVR